MIRKPTIKDFDSCKIIALQLAKKYPDLRPNNESIKRLFDECVSGARNFSLVSEDNGEITGCLFAISYDNLWAQKQSSCALLWSCSNTADGVSMLRAYREWIDSRPAIRRGGFQFDCEIDERVLKVLQKIGFRKSGGCYLRTKGINNGNAVEN